MLRIVMGVVAGVVVAIAAIFGMELVSRMLFPPPAGLDPMDPEDIKLIVAQMPLAAFLFVVLGYVVGAGVGGWAAKRIARRRWPALLVGAFVALGSIGNAFMIPQPLWMNALSILAPLLAAWAVSPWVPGGPEAA